LSPLAIGLRRTDHVLVWIYGMFVIETENMGLSAFGVVEGIELPGQAVLDVRKLDFWPGLNPEAERPKIDALRMP
jgi:hypothetical protein